MRLTLTLLILMLFTQPLLSQRVDKQLQKQVEELISGFHGDVGIYIKNINNNKIVAFCSDTVFPTASLVKIPILIGILNKIEQGERSYTEKMIYRDSLLYPGADILGSFRAGEQIELGKLIMLMMTMSDNTASLWLQSLAGTGVRINMILDSLSLKATRSNSRTPGREAHRSIYGWGQSTPREMVELMEKMHRRQLLSAAASEKMLRLMNRNYFDEVSLSELPPEAAVFAKYGAVNQTRNEVVLVKGEKARYVFCIMTKNNQDQSWKQENEAWQLTRRISKLLWNYFEPGSRWSPPTGVEKFR